ncbi:hypothetical protein [Nocardioides sp. KR10-350]|uniref:hypothetical protein n=1 Tax=Nocardioides cheoyonin TaxID=3156615 RepID=UPI0032B5BCA5
MLILLALPVIVAVAAMHRYLQDYAPSNVLIRRVRTHRPRCRTAFALAAVAGVLQIAMHAVAAAVAGGAPGWLNLVVLILAWDTIKLVAATLETFLRATWVGARRVRLRVAEPGRATP